MVHRKVRGIKEYYVHIEVKEKGTKLSRRADNINFLHVVDL